MVLMMIAACFTAFTACENPQDSSSNPISQSQSGSSQSGGSENGNNNTGSSGGSVISPIKPGGDYEVGGNYSK